MMHDVAEGLLEMRKLLAQADKASRSPGSGLVELETALVGMISVGAQTLARASRDAGNHGIGVPVLPRRAGPLLGAVQHAHAEAA